MNTRDTRRNIAPAAAMLVLVPRLALRAVEKHKSGKDSIMTKRTDNREIALPGRAVFALSIAAALVPAVGAQPVSLAAATIPRFGSVDERFQSFNTEMLEVTGAVSGSHIKTTPPAPSRCP